MRGYAGCSVCARLADALAAGTFSAAAHAQDDFPGGKPIELTLAIQSLGLKKRAN